MKDRWFYYMYDSKFQLMRVSSVDKEKRSEVKHHGFIKGPEVSSLFDTLQSSDDQTQQDILSSVALSL